MKFRLTIIKLFFAVRIFQNESLAEDVHSRSKHLNFNLNEFAPRSMEKPKPHGLTVDLVELIFKNTQYKIAVVTNSTGRQSLSDLKTQS